MRDVLIKKKERKIWYELKTNKFKPTGFSLEENEKLSSITMLYIKIKIKIRQKHRINDIPMQKLR